MRRTDYVIALLERIAFQTWGGPFTFQDYLDKVVVADAIARRNQVQGKDDFEWKEDPTRFRKGHKSRH